MGFLGEGRMTEEPADIEVIADETFHPIDVRYAADVGLDELRRAFVLYAVMGLSSQVSIPIDRVVPLCGELHAFLTGEKPALRAVK